MSYLHVQGHQSMTFDYRRNQAYYDALEKVITPDSVVLDLGSGAGIHGILAAKLGAKKVYLVEPQDIIAVANQIAQLNGFSDRIECLKGKIEEIDLPEKVDVIISVFTGNFLLEEDLLPSLFYARDKYLKPGGVLIPEGAVMEAVPVYAPEIYNANIAAWSQPHMEIDQSPGRTYASQAIYYRTSLSKAKYLAEPHDLLAMDFYQATSTYCQTQVNFTIKELGEEPGLCHGFAGWFRMQLGDTWLSTAPHEPALHWSPAFLPLDPPIEVTAGEEISFKLQRPPFGDWVWQVKTSKTQQLRSTFFSTPRTIKTIKKIAHDYQPQINEKGKAAMYVLSHSDGTFSIKELGHYVKKEYPQLFSSSEKAIDFVQNLVGSFS